MGVGITLDAAALALISPGAAQETCSAFRLQLGSSFLEIPHENGKNDTPRVTFENGKGGRKGGLLHEVLRCSGDIQNIRSIEILELESPFPSLVRQGKFPSYVLLRRLPGLGAQMRGLLEEQVKTRCRDGFDRDLGSELGLRKHNTYGCLKASGRHLIWICNHSSIVPDRCRIASHHHGLFYLNYHWSEKRVDHDKVYQLDKAVIDYLNSMIVAGERLPE